ncbi:DNA mismatch repair protein MutS [Neolewinella lacunae]|uniref:DNA mismatch repair protein MutS n=1 Tax=Neolewinella lacunae TaxID=1517758 RepID=A0A923PGP5_9BACT|nr:DNA mismatch repair protein MutS [Neolewinella lacunae]MBC6993788.1 DNA mismatch repair protein MutS [Neolewinella lacunae]MDN3635321.1 DNA mismatch repair protein MutS [Neolewinella lacunae]
MAKSKDKGDGKVTPLMKQYQQVKAKHPDSLLLFRVGDFYETFGEDAIKTAQTLGIIQTSRNNGGSDVELAGFPYHSLDTYLPRLVKAGYRVAICEQLEKPSKEKKIVRRGVTEIVTPGLAVDDKLLEHKTNNFLACVTYAGGKRDQYGLSLLDISTGEFLVAEGPADYTDKLLQSFQPKEVLLSKDRKKDFLERFGDRFYLTPRDEWIFTEDYTQEKLLRQFQAISLKGFGIEKLLLGQIAAGAILHYLETTENRNLQHITRINRLANDRYVWLDRFTIRNLELLYSPHDNGVPLVEVLDHTVTPMGGRLLRKWVVLPLLDAEAIRARHTVVRALVERPALLQDLDERLRVIGDLERLISKVPLGKVNPREVRSLRAALSALGPIRRLLAESANPVLADMAERLDDLPAVGAEIDRRLQESPAVNLNKGGVIADGFDAELDDLRDITRNGKGRLADIQRREAERTGISSLKIGFNNVFGYYLEVTNKYKDQAPADWTRKQTLTNGERYITEELKILEDKILNAEDKILQREEALYEDLIVWLQDYISPVQQNAALIGKLDCLLSFAKIANRNRYVMPELDDSKDIEIIQGRHPVIERQLAVGEQYVPNDVHLDPEDQQIIMITGPNMAGKSALLRQTALICLMAQMGSFVPAERARLGLIDRVFTRVGASDNISSGESTFMVEMNETASIMNNVTDRSLVLLDEIGRGTSTFDGISIAWAIAEYLHSNGQARPKTLFATHYHELNELADRHPRIRNYSIAIKEHGNRIIFLRRLVPGGSQHSFGIHVARMAGMPPEIITRATDILAQLESQHIDADGRAAAGAELRDKEQGQAGPQAKPVAARQFSQPAPQLSIFETVDPTAGRIKAALEELNLNNMTPIECMMKLNELRRMLEG